MRTGNGEAVPTGSFSSVRPSIFPNTTAVRSGTGHFSCKAYLSAPIGALNEGECHGLDVSNSNPSIDRGPASLAGRPHCVAGGVFASRYPKEIGNQSLWGRPRLPSKSKAVSSQPGTTLSGFRTLQSINAVSASAALQQSIRNVTVTNRRLLGGVTASNLRDALRRMSFVNTR